MSLTISRLGHLGDGVAEGPVFVPRSLPGEVVDGAVSGDRIPQPRILQPSPDRVRPPCPHYKGCGGCHLMHASDRFVADWKADVVRQALTARDLPAPIRGVITSPAQSRRRATLSGRRLKSGPVVGFHARGSDTVIAVPDCRLLAPALLPAIDAAGEITAERCSRKGEMQFAVLVTEGGIDMDIRGGAVLDGPGRIALAALAERHDLARLSVDGEAVVERRPPVLTFGGVAVAPPPGAFVQATTEGEAALAAGVAEAVGPTARQVVDLFAGAGTFALPLAARAEVLAVEGDPALIAALDRGWRKGTGLKRVETETRDLFRRPLEASELGRFDAAVIDPPRAGAEAQMRALAEAGVPRIATVSCNPVTFARDAAILAAGGYDLCWIDVVDQFRWSPHVELVAAFELTHMPGGR